MEAVRDLLPVALGLYALEGTGGYDELKSAIRTWAKKDPIDALVAVVVGGGIAFYHAEKATNANCTTPWDGILYMSTALSVGYDNLFPTTPVGHALATFAQTFGPALANGALDAPAAEQPDPDVVQKQILAKLDEIATLLAQR